MAYQRESTEHIGSTSLRSKKMVSLKNLYGSLLFTFSPESLTFCLALDIILQKKQVFQGGTVLAYFRGKGNLDKITIWHGRLILIL